VVVVAVVLVVVTPGAPVVVVEVVVVGTQATRISCPANAPGLGGRSGQPHGPEQVV